MRKTKTRESIIVLLVGSLPIGFLFRHLLISGFDESLVNILDGRLLVGIAEHWYLFFKGSVPWRDLSMFYPLTGTLGFSDALFLYSIPYSILRSVGLDQYVSWDLTMIFYGLIGYLGMYGLLKRVGNVSSVASVLGATFFLLGAPMVTILRNSHHQLFVVWLLPVTTICILKAIRFSGHAGIKFYQWSLLSIVLVGSIAYTGFYIFWFVSLLTFIGLVTWFLHGGCSGFSWRACLDNLTVGTFLRSSRGMIRSVNPRLIITIAVFVLAFLPFVLTYLPVLQARNIVQYGTYEEMLPTFSDFVYPGQHNIFYGEWFGSRDFQERPYSWELSYGVTMGFLLFSLGGAVLYIAIGPKDLEEKLPRKRLILTLISVAFISALFMLQVGDTSLWGIIRKTLPGAAAIRAVFRMNILLYTIILIVGVVSWDSVWKLCKASPKRRYFILLGVTVALVEQVGHSYFDDRVNWLDEYHVTKEVVAPNEAIETFFLTRMNDKVRGDPGVTAFRVAQKIGIPTIQGLSGLYPSGYRVHLYRVGSSNYFREIRRWIQLNNITGPIGELDLHDLQWKVHPAERFLEPSVFFDLGSNILEQDHIEAEDYLQRGWSHIEPWGVWAEKETSTIVLYAREVPREGFELSLSLRAFLPNKKHKVTSSLSIGGVELMALNFTRKNPRMQVSIQIDASQFRNNTLVLKFQTEGLTSPKQHGISLDERTLGIGVASIVLRPRDE